MNHDLIVVLSSYLSPWDLIRLGATCRALQSRVLDSSRVWRIKIELCFEVPIKEIPALETSRDFLTRFMESFRRRGQTHFSSTFVKHTFLGSQRCGKSHMCRVFGEQTAITKNLDAYISTIGVELVIRRIVSATGRECKIQCWELGGNPKFMAVSRAYYRGSDVLSTKFF
jgi:hypothetical protein